jgi:hypothetical protein
MAQVQVLSKVAGPGITVTAVEPSRRFQLPDLDTHGRWIIARLLKVYPHRTERDLIGFLRGIIGSNDYLFLYRDCGVALATVAKTNPLVLKSHVEEIFVWVAPGHNPTEAAPFYEDFAQWTRHQSLDVLIVEEQTDVPHEVIKATLDKRLFTKTVQFARV